MVGRSEKIIRVVLPEVQVRTRVNITKIRIIHLLLTYIVALRIEKSKTSSTTSGITNKLYSFPVEPRIDDSYLLRGNRTVPKIMPHTSLGTKLIESYKYCSS